MSFIIIKSFVKKVFAFFKSYWFIPVAVLLVLYAIFLRKKPSISIIDELDAAHTAHAKELDVIEKEKKSIEDQRKKIEDRAALVRAQVEKEFQNAQRELTEQKKKRIEKLIKKFKDDPAALADEIERETDIRVIVVD